MVTPRGPVDRSSGTAEARASRQGALWPRLGRAVTFPGTEAGESRHRRRPAGATVVRSGYRGNGGASSGWAAIVSPRHFQTALSAGAIGGQREEPVRTAGSPGRCAAGRSRRRRERR